MNAKIQLSGDAINHADFEWPASGQISMIEMPLDQLTGSAGADVFFGQNQWLSTDVPMMLKFGLGARRAWPGSQQSQLGLVLPHRLPRATAAGCF